MRASLAVQTSPRFHLGAACMSTGMQACVPPDVQLWAVVHVATDIMFKDALCSDNYLIKDQLELAAGEYRLPRLAHYDGALDMDSIVDWL